MMNVDGSEILYVSPSYEVVWGRTSESLYRRPLSWLESIHPDDRAQAHSVFQRQLLGEQIDSEYRIGTPQGIERWIRDRAFPIYDDDGQLYRVAGIAEADHDYLDNLLNTLPDKYQALNRQAIYGDFFTFYLCNLVLKVNGKGGQPVYVKVAGQSTGRCTPK